MLCANFTYHLTEIIIFLLILNKVKDTNMAIIVSKYQMTNVTVYFIESMNILSNHAW